MDVDVVGRMLSSCPRTTTTRTAPARGARRRVEWRRRRPRRRRGRDSRPTSTASTCATPRTRCTRRSSATTRSTATAWCTSVGFRDGQADYRNRFVRTDGFAAEQDGRRAAVGRHRRAARRSRVREDGWGARGRMKDASSTDVVVHAGTALTSFYQCGDLYRARPAARSSRSGSATWNGRFPADWGVSAHPKVDDRTGELLVLQLRQRARRTCTTASSTRPTTSCTTSTCRCPGPRLPHDMAFTEHYAILNDLPAVLGPRARSRRARTSPRFHPDLPTRFAVIPRRGDDERRPLVRGRRRPTCCTGSTRTRTATRSCSTASSRATRCRRDDGVGDRYQRLFRFLALDRHADAPAPLAAQPRAPGACKEEQLSDTHQRVRDDQRRATRAAVPLHVRRRPACPAGSSSTASSSSTSQTGAEERYALRRRRVRAARPPMAPRVGATAEDDGYLVTFTTDMNATAPSASSSTRPDVADGPIARVRLPERISSGTHSTWAPGAELRRWSTAETAADAIGL